MDLEFSGFNFRNFEFYLWNKEFEDLALGILDILS